MTETAAGRGQRTTVGPDDPFVTQIAWLVATTGGKDKKAKSREGQEKKNMGTTDPKGVPLELRLATGSGGQFYRGKGGSTVEFWDRETGQRLPTLHRTENVVWGLAFSPDGTELALGGTNPQVEVRDAHTGAVRWSKHEPTLPQAMSIAFSPDGKTLAVGFGKYSQEDAFPVKI